MKTSIAQLQRRLLPLYIASFLQSFVLWYAIDKLFMKSIGFSNTGIGVMVALYSLAMLIVETPSGVIADRWSRKGVLVIASISLALSSLIGGLSNSPAVYIVMAIFWGIYAACYSGMYDAIIYDVIAETGHKASLFDKIYGRLQFYDAIGLVAGSLLGGLVASTLNLRAVYFISIIPALIAVPLLLRFHEPSLHKKHVAIPIREQLSAVFTAIFRHHELALVVVVLVLQSAVIYLLLEFSQLWLIALHVPTNYFGLATAILLSSIGFGGLMVDKIKLSRYGVMVGMLGLMLLACVGLVVFRTPPLIVAAQLIVSTSLIGIYTIFSRLLHDGVEARIRAGASSATSTVGRALIIPLALLFSFVSQRTTIFGASIIILIIAAIMAALVLVVANRKNRTGLLSQ